MKQTSLYKKYVYEVFKNICISYVYGENIYAK